MALGGAVVLSGAMGGGAPSAGSPQAGRYGGSAALAAANGYKQSEEQAKNATSAVPTSVPTLALSTPASEARAPQSPLENASTADVAPTETSTPDSAAPLEAPADAPDVTPPTATTAAPAPQAAQPAATPPPPTATPEPPEPTAPPPPPTPVPPTATTAPAPPAASVSLGGMEQAMFVQHNQQRAAAGVAALQLDSSLESVARQRAQDMASKGYFSHTSPTGVSAFTLLDGIGYSYAIAGENIARNNYPDADSVNTAMTGFMNSPGHRENILEPRFTRVGIAMAEGADGMKYFAVVFAG
ncbi:MAG TPA: CAP domain-containing protein [Dehalococcoidia bacterium]|nr:CAP domain-containing protein [Dehalococcoidia bacterium]